MDQFAVVRPEHLNHTGFLFGGQMLKWVDEYAWLAAVRNFPGAALVTRAMDNIEFHHRVPNGSILRFSVNLDRLGTTSVCYAVDVWNENYPNGTDPVFSTHITFVNLGASAKAAPLPPMRASDGCEG